MIPTLSKAHSLLTFSATAYAASNYAAFPPSIPLSVRSPYMSVWHNSTDGSGGLSRSGQHFWGRPEAYNMGLQGTVRVDGESFIWLGGDDTFTAANITDFQLKPTHSTFTLEAGPMTLNVTFLSPIELSDWVKQSLPFTYVIVEAAALDQVPHDVQLYMDIRGEWASGDTRVNQTMFGWSNHSTSTAFYHQFAVQDPQPFQEYHNQAQDGTVYHAMAMEPSLTWEININNIITPQFIQHGFLTNETLHPTYAYFNGPSEHLFAIVVNLGSIQKTSSPVTWAIGFVRDPNVQYITPTGEVQNRRPYFVTQYTNFTEDDMIDSVVEQISETYSQALELDRRLMDDASNISDQYADLVSLATRQAAGALDITVGNEAKDNIEGSDVMAFMKDIGSFRIPRVNPVERIFAAFPMYLYLNASLCGAILRPLLQAQNSLTGQPYASHDLGSTYPIASGSRGDSTLGIEESGNMLIMMYAHARYSGDGSLLSYYYSTTKRWADYLVNHTLTPEDQQSADGIMLDNMTNLALKGIIGVKAMAEIARVTDNPVDAERYDTTAAALISSWESLAMSSSGSHLLGVYGDEESWSMLYNAYADRLLGTGLLSQSLLSNQTQFYDSLLDTAPRLGLAIDSHLEFQNVSIAWTLFTAATVTDNNVRDRLIQQAWSLAFNNATFAFGMGDQYSNTSNSIQVIGDAGPAGGAVYSLLALTLPNVTIAVPGSPSSPQTGIGNKHRKKSVEGIAAGVASGSVVFGIISTVIFCRVLRRRRRALVLEPDAYIMPIRVIPRANDARNSHISSIHLASAEVLRPLNEGEVKTQRAPIPEIDPQASRVALHRSQVPSYHTAPPPEYRTDDGEL